jgi:hypothetical protein
MPEVEGVQREPPSRDQQSIRLAALLRPRALQVLTGLAFFEAWID